MFLDEREYINQKDRAKDKVRIESKFYGSSNCDSDQEKTALIYPD